ncbi:MAG: hypothetical protein K8L99_27560 [Anaerolineae bacterium]|nr:hypothetical protein [Anaerolineae bacterium]
MIAAVIRWVLLIIGLNCAIVLLAMALGAQTSGSGQLVYEARRQRSSGLYLLDVDHNLTRNLTYYNEAAINTRPSWSPDGSQLVFEVRRVGRIAIYIMDATGRNYRPLAGSLALNQYSPTWVDDGQAVQFLARSQLDPIIYQADPKTGIFQKLAPDIPVSSPTASQNLMVMTYRNGHWGISTYEGDWDNLRHLTNNGVRFNEPPQLSHDGRRIAFISSDKGGMAEIYVMNADGSSFRRVTHDGILKTNLLWRP